jgi:hypothetical protein
VRFSQPIHFGGFNLIHLDLLGLGATVTASLQSVASNAGGGPAAHLNLIFENFFALHFLTWTLP